MYLLQNYLLKFVFSVNFDHFQILRAIGKGSFGKVNFIFYILYYTYKRKKNWNHVK